MTKQEISKRKCGWKLIVYLNPFNGIPEYTRPHTHAVIWSKFEKNEKKLDAKGVKLLGSSLPYSCKKMDVKMKMMNYSIQTKII